MTEQTPQEARTPQQVRPRPPDDPNKRFARIYYIVAAAYFFYELLSKIVSWFINQDKYW